EGLRLLLEDAVKAVERRPEFDPATVRRLRADLGNLRATARDKPKTAQKIKGLLQFYAGDARFQDLFRIALGRLDPNRWFADDRARAGAYNTPASILQGVRTGV